MKTIELIKTALDLGPKAYLDFVMKEQKRLGLKALFFFLQTQIQLGKEPSKAELFAQISPLPYEKQRDYLLRNELRLLNEVLINFIEERYHYQHWQQNPNQAKLALLRLWLARQQFKWFEQDWKKRYEEALNLQDHQTLCDLAELWGDYLQASGQMNLSAWTELTQLLGQALAWAQWQGEENLARLKRRWAAAQRNQLAFEGAWPPEQNLSPPAPAPQQNISLWLENLAHTYLLHGNKKIEQSQILVSQAENIVQQRPQYAPLVFALRNNLALEYVFRQDFDQALPLFQQLLNSKELTSQAQALQTSILFNYLTCLAHAQNFQALLQAITQHQDLVLAQGHFFHRFLSMEALAYIFLGQSNQALDCLLRQSHYPASEQDEYYLRILFLMAYFQLEEWELCQREITNILQCLHYRKPENLPYATTTAKAFRQFINLWQKRNQKTSKAKLQTLKANILAQRKAIFDFENLQTLWLLRQLDLSFKEEN